MPCLVVALIKPIKAKPIELDRFKTYKGGVHMPNLILTDGTHCDRVRALLGVDRAYLSDETINSPDFLTMSELNMIKLVPKYQELTGEDKQYFESATICDLAARLCPSMKNRLPKKSAGVHYQSELATDWDKLKAMLLYERENLLQSISGYETKASFRFGLTFK